MAPRREGVEYDVEPAGDRLLDHPQRRQPRLRPRLGAAGRARRPTQWPPFVRRGRGRALRQGVEAFDDVRRRVAAPGRADRAAGRCRATRSPRPASAPPHDLDFDEPLYSVGTRRQPRVRRDARCRSSSSPWSPRGPSPTTTSRTGELHPAQAAAGARRLRPGGVRAAPRVGHRARRHPGADLAGLPPGRRAGRHRARRCSTATAPTRSPSTRTSRWPGSRCSTAASSTPSRTCAAAARWAARWYDDGKLDAQAQHLHRLRRLRRPPRRDAAGSRRTGLSAEGGSAGGLLIGAVVNLAPERFRRRARRGAVRRRADHDPRPDACR